MKYIHLFSKKSKTFIKTDFTIIHNRPFARYGRNLYSRCILGNKKKFWVTLGANKPIGTAILQWKRKVLVVSRLLLVNSLVLLSLNMGKSDHCTVYGCNNDRRYPERYVIKDHISKTFACDTEVFHLSRKKVEIKI